jgi:zinc protease
MHRNSIMKKHTVLSAVVGAVVGSAIALTAAPAAAQDLPKRPESLAFRPLVFNPPNASDYRHVLSNGVVVFLAPSKELPLIELSMTFRGGSYLEPAGKVGLASMTASLLRTGGTETLAPNELDERLDFLATEISIGADDTVCSAAIDTLKANFDESLALLMDMLTKPRFDESKTQIAVNIAIEGMKQRNDDADPILSREWNMLLFGADHFEARVPTEASIRGIAKDDMSAFARKVFNPANVVIAVTGDFEVPEMLAKLEKALAAWPTGERMPVPQAPAANFEPGVYHVGKDIPQGKVFIGSRGITRDDPDYFAALVMNEILGGGGFTSRIMKTVRSDEGLAYSAGSGFDAGVWYPGQFRASFQSKNATVALAIKLIEREFSKMRDTPVGAEELEVAKQSFIETFPRSFESKDAMLGIFVSDEWTGRDPAYWQTYRDNIAQVTADDVQRVAKRMLDFSKMAVFVVGDWNAIAPGDAMPGKPARATMAEFFNDSVNHLPLRDPLSMQPIK